ncbi:MAG: hypothetical protein QM765_32535 [Myxococcales bacterium]
MPETVANPPPAEPAPPARERVPSPMSRQRSPNLLQRFLLSGAGSEGHVEHTYPWWKVLWLTGVDYFSTLGYQPGIAFLAAGVLSPIATALVVLVTLFGALPTYVAVAKRSYIGLGSVAMLEKMLTGWKGKLVVLMLLGFAATAFVITITLSAADAAKHAVENPLLLPYLGHHAMAVTLVLIFLLTAVFLRGFGEAIGAAIFVGAPYVLLNVVVIGWAAITIALHPESMQHFRLELAARGDFVSLLLASTIVFPKLALGMSGFETGVTVMPLIHGEKVGPKDSEKEKIAGRVHATRKLLASAALLMSGLLIGSAVVTTVLIPAAEFAPGGKANGRALAYLAHELMGHGFGSVYDIVTILILWFAGASAMAGLLSLIPRYLPRFGMAPGWVRYNRPLILIIFGACALVTWFFQADVDSQGGAYATGVLALILSASLAVALATWREDRSAGRLPLKSLYFWGVSAVFVFTLFDNIVERPDGLIISILFCLLVLGVSGFSRFRRATELRVEKLTFLDEESEKILGVHQGQEGQPGAAAHRRPRLEPGQGRGDPALLPHHRAHRVPARQPARRPQRVQLGAAGARRARRARPGGPGHHPHLRCGGHRQHHRLRQRAAGPHRALLGADHLQQDGAVLQVPALGRGRGRGAGLRDSGAVLGVDSRGRRPAADLPDERVIAEGNPCVETLRWQFWRRRPWQGAARAAAWT